MPTLAPPITLYTFDDIFVAGVGNPDVLYADQYSPGLTVLAGASSLYLFDALDAAPFGALDPAVSAEATLRIEATTATLARNADFNRFRSGLFQVGPPQALELRNSSNALQASYSVGNSGTVDDRTFGSQLPSRRVSFLTGSSDLKLDNLRFWYVIPEDGTTDPYSDQVELHVGFTGTAGSTAFTDVSTRARAITTNGGVTVSSAQPNSSANAGLFNGTNGYLSVPSSSGFSLLERFTVQGWFRLTTISGSNQTLFHLAPTGATASASVFEMFFDVATSKLKVNFFGTAITNIGAPLLANQWYYICFTGAGPTINLSLNRGSGPEFTSGYNATRPAASKVRFGANHSAANFFSGYLQDWRLTNDVDRDAYFFPTTLFPGLSSGPPATSVVVSATEPGQDAFSSSVVAPPLTSVTLLAVESGQDTFVSSVQAGKVVASTSSSTGMAFDGVGQLRLDPVDKFVFDGFKQRFTEVFNTPTAWVTSTDKVKILDRLFPGRSSGGKPVYPYAFLKITGMELAQDRMNLNWSTGTGIPVVMSTDGKSFQSVQLMPVNFSVTVEFVTNNFRTLLDFSRKWLFASRNGALSFQVEYGVTTLNIGMNIDPTVNIPQREASPEEVQEYTAEISMVVIGYISEPIPDQQGVVDTLEVSAAVESINGASNEVFWSFTTPTRR